MRWSLRSGEHIGATLYFREQWLTAKNGGDIEVFNDSQMQTPFKHVFVRYVISDYILVDTMSM